MSAKIINAPRLTISRKLRKPRSYNPDHQYQFRYRSKAHVELPHVVKFSGGRSSGMMMFALLENNILNAHRGDVIIFNNTGAEHPETYQFAAQCKEIVENLYGIPFFWIEFQTYEDARGGTWVRQPSYRLVNTDVWSKENPDGYHNRGEPFEEMLSWQGHVPNQFQRTCTKKLKLETTRMFLRDWLACKASIPRLGHWQDEPQVDKDSLYRVHRKNGGSVPKDIFLQKKVFVLSRPVFRPEQCFSEFALSPIAIDNPILKGKAYGGNADFGAGGIEYTAFIGLRDDEQSRVQRVEARAASGAGVKGYEGEHVYMPLADMNITGKNVETFWQDQSWGLNLPTEGYMSNCVYCFLKGTANLSKVRGDLHDLSADMKDTPSDIAWWSRIESTYRRDIKAEGRKTKEGSNTQFIGFFGANLTYREILDKGPVALAEHETMLPCDCTD